MQSELTDKQSNQVLGQTVDSVIISEDSFCTDMSMRTGYKPPSQAPALPVGGLAAGAAAQQLQKSTSKSPRINAPPAAADSALIREQQRQIDQLKQEKKKVADFLTNEIYPLMNELRIKNLDQ